MSLSIENKIALVTGANRGIGKAIVESFLEHGAKKVYLAVRNPESTRELAQKYGDKVVTLQVDVADADSIKNLAEHAKDVNVVVNNAGVLEIADPLSSNVEEALTKELNINVFGLIRIAKAFAPILEANSGALVQLNSVASIKNFTGFSTYSASKAAAYSLTQGLRDQLAPKGITVLSVHPGPIATDMGKKAGFEVADPSSSVSEGIVASLKAGDFHLFPDTVAKQFEGAYQGFADAIINADLSE
ncbi:MAG: NAD(P)-dependent dehydrogenase (short-subunit alcohol dehydrogenase family) [Oleiphilaceae bacterium]|jgi:NAD(P)-dependent dehydrogenase (short-subunit alcohol dehydrogenase family)